MDRGLEFRTGIFKEVPWLPVTTFDSPQMIDQDRVPYGTSYHVELEIGRCRSISRSPGQQKIYLETDSHSGMCETGCRWVRCLEVKTSSRVLHSWLTLTVTISVLINTNIHTCQP